VISASCLWPAPTPHRTKVAAVAFSFILEPACRWKAKSVEAHRGQHSPTWGGRQEDVSRKERITFRRPTHAAAENKLTIPQPGAQRRPGRAVSPRSASSSWSTMPCGAVSARLCVRRRLCTLTPGVCGGCALCLCTRAWMRWPANPGSSGIFPSRVACCTV
jgi:hypothetical protein